MKDFNIPQALGYVLGIVYVTGTLYLCKALGGNIVLNYLAFILGSALGFVTGILVSPKWEGQADMFREYGRAITTFLSGFLLAKIEKPIQAAFSELSADTDVLIGRLIIFASMVLIGALFSWKAREAEMQKAASIRTSTIIRIT